MKKLFCCLAFGAFFSAALAATPLTIVQVQEHALACLLSANCVVNSTLTNSTFTLTGVAGNGVLHTRTAAVTAGVAAGETIYAYRVDMTAARQSATGGSVCVKNMTINFGPDSPLAYIPATAANGAISGDVFVISSGGPGTVGLASATRNGNAITFVFSTPICPTMPAITHVAAGTSSFLFGLAAPTAPKAGVALLAASPTVTATPATRIPTH